MSKISYFYRSLLWPIFLLGFLVGVAAFVYSLIEDSAQQVQQNYQGQLSEVNFLYNEINDIQQRIDLVHTYFGRFQLVKQSGYLDDQSRVNWIDRLIGLVAVYGVRGATVNFSSREVLGVGQQSSLTSFSEVLQREYLDIEGQLQHEGDVLNLIADITHKVNPLAILDTCSLTSLNLKNQHGLTDSHYTFQVDRGNIAIKCRFNFLVLNVPKIAPTVEVQP